MKTIVAVTFILAAGCLAWMASEQVPPLPEGSKYTEILQGPARTLAALSILAAFAAGLLL